MASKSSPTSRRSRSARPSAGDTSADLRLKPGDVLTILQIPGWTDIGRFATVKGEVKFPGSYGINEGERLSSLMKRVGGFRSTAYPAGAVLERVEVRQLEEKGRQELIRRIETSTATVHFSPTSTGQDQAAMLQALQQQQTQTLNRLRSQPAAGRLVITISGRYRGVGKHSRRHLSARRRCDYHSPEAELCACLRAGL